MIAVAEPRAAAKLLIVREPDPAGARRLPLHGEVEGDRVVRAARIQPHRGKALGARESAQSLCKLRRLHRVRTCEAEQAAQLERAPLLRPCT